MKLSRIIGIMLMLSAPLSFAQQPEDEENLLDEIVVTATRIATPLADTLPSTQVITTEEIERLKPRDLGDLLSRKSGLTFSDRGGRGSSGSIFLRGSNSDQLIFLIDGVRTASATLGGTAIQRIPLESIERIEIVKGPMSGVYGANAIGGVIQIFTKQYHDIGSFAIIEGTAGSNRFRQFTAQAGYGDDGYNVSVSLSKESTEGIDRTAFKGGGNEDRDGFEQSVRNFSFATSLQDRLDLRISHVRSSGRVEYDNTSTFGSSSRANIGEDWHSRTKLETTSARIDYDHSEKLSISGILGAATDFYRDIKLDHTTADSRITHFETKKTDFSIQANLNLSAQNRLSLGVDYQKDKVDSTTDYDVKKRDNKGVFALWQRRGEQSSTVINARYDKNDVFGSVSNYSIQQSYDISDQFQLVASYGTAFKAPTFNDLFWPDVGNPDLMPEESKSAELSLRANYGDLFWQVNAYQTKVTNLIAWAPIPNDPDNRRQPSNINNATMKGIEFDLTSEWNDYIFNTSMEYLDAQDDNTGRFLDGRARASASFELGRQIDNLYIGANAYFEHARFD
ncbi:MAG: TonB-dependent receptor, partial [Gammaproteobacteria bacterium]|nr:TonB-dependent receptor [Gammaproteobacteria bacterium]